MALGDSYASRDDLKARLKIIDTNDDATILDCLDAASRSIEGPNGAGRQFNLDTAVTTRIYYATSQGVVYVDDFASSAGLVVKTDDVDDGSFSTTWAASDYVLQPLNGIVNGQTGWPYWYLAAVGTKTFPVSGRPDFVGPASGPVWRFYSNSALPTIHRRPGVQITATFGWPRVPSNVKQACLILAEELFKVKDAPFGVAGFADYGAVRVRENPKVASLLQNYTRGTFVFA